METPLAIRARSFPGKVWQLAKPYWNSEERWQARGLLAVIVAFTLGLVYMAVQFNTWNKEFYNSLEQKNYDDFKDLLLYFCFLAAVYIALGVYKLYLTQMLQMRWRIWLTRHYLGAWLERQVSSRLALASRGDETPVRRLSRTCACFPVAR
jgi:putative ATP-binding cassette transporter